MGSQIALKSACHCMLVSRACMIAAWAESACTLAVRCACFTSGVLAEGQIAAHSEGLMRLISFCLAGSHIAGPARRMLTTEGREGVTFDREAPQWDLKEFVPVEVRCMTFFSDCMPFKELAFE